MSPRKRTRKPKLWRYTAGERPYTVTVEEIAPGSVLYERLWHPGVRRQVRRSLKHRDQEKARAHAEAAARALREGVVAQPTVLTVGQVVELYLVHRTPAKRSAKTRREDHRRAALWQRVLGAGRAVKTLGRAEWDRFILERSTGAIDEHGVPVPDEIDPKTKKPRRWPVGPRTVDADLVFLVAVFNWALTWNRPDGSTLLDRNPWGAIAPGVKRALERPRNRAPRRPVATYDRYLAVRAKCDLVTMVVPGRKKGESRVRSYVGDLLDLVEQTGRRREQVCALRYADLVRQGDAPDGALVAIRWRPVKHSDEVVVPISAETRAVLERILVERPQPAGTPEAPLFPALHDPTRPIHPDLASEWLRKAETLAQVPKLPGGLWHPYRRKWATERKALPEKDVMFAGGWKTADVLRTSYQAVDDATVLAVVNTPTRLVARTPDAGAQAPAPPETGPPSSVPEG